VAKTFLKSESFVGRDGKAVEYQRLVIASEKNSKLKMEIRLDATQLVLAQAIFDTDGQK